MFKLRWFITSIGTTNCCKWADIWRYFIFYFDSNMISNKLKGLDCLLLLVRAVPGLQNSQKHRSC